MKKITCILLAMLFCFSLTSCTVEEFTPKTSAEIIEEVKGNYFSSEAIEKFRETKSTKDSFEGLYVMRIDDDGVMVGDGHQGASVGKIDLAENKEKGVYTFEAKKDDKNHFKATYYAEEGVADATFKTDFSQSGEEYNIKYKRFDTDADITSALTEILFENTENVIKEEGKFFAEADGVKYELMVSYSVAETGIMKLGYDGSIILKGGSKIISGAYKAEDGKVIIAGASGEELFTLE